MTVGRIAVDKLKPHPKNGYYFSDVEGEKYEEIKRSIATYGIRDPLKVSTDYVVISGHQRLRIAKELGLTSVPVEIVDPNESEDVKSGRVTAEQYLEYLLIAENVERRGQAETDPIKKSRIASFLKEYWGIQRGNFYGNQVSAKTADTKTISEIAEVIGESKRSTERLLKLHDLIPPLQDLVSKGKLGTTAAEQLAYLTEDEQRSLYESIGESVARLTVAEAGEIKQEARKARESGDDFKEVIERLKREKEEAEQRALFAERRLKEMAAQAPKVREVVKEVVPPEVKRKLEEAQRRVAELERQLKEQENDIKRVEKIREEIERLSLQRDDLRRQIDSALELSALYVEIENLLKTKLAPIKYSRALTERRDSEVVIENLRGIIAMVEEWCYEMKSYLPKGKYIEAEVIEV